MTRDDTDYVNAIKYLYPKIKHSIVPAVYFDIHAKCSGMNLKIFNKYKCDISWLNIRNNALKVSYKFKFESARPKICCIQVCQAQHTSMSVHKVS